VTVRPLVLSQTAAVGAITQDGLALTVTSTKLIQGHPVGAVIVTEIWAVPVERALDFQVSVDVSAPETA